MIDVKQNKNGDLIIRVPGAYLRHWVKYGDNFPEGSRVTNTKVFSDGVLSALNQEQDDGTTLVHEMVDRAIEAAMDDGCEGFKLGDDGW